MSPPPAISMEQDVFPCPIFEGSEKRISVTFAPISDTPPSNASGLRALTRAQLDAMLDLAACQIVSSRSNRYFDAYVLSESSLFVYPDRIILKTCGTTKLLDAVPMMVELARSVGMAPTRVKYSRASFLFPHKQPEVYQSFDNECAMLNAVFAKTLPSSAAYVLGDSLSGSLQWHIYVASINNQQRTVPMQSPIHTLEVCMTGIATNKAAQFFRTPEFVSSQHTTMSSGIAALVKSHAIDDYVFEPCGYSMNGMASTTELSTIHITPEDGFSYASFELCGYNPDRTSVDELVSRCADIFNPQCMCVTMSADAQTVVGWGGAFLTPAGYDCNSASFQEVSSGGYVAYFALGRRGNDLSSAAAVAGDAPMHRKKGSSVSSIDSPRAVLKHFPSYKTLPSGHASILGDIDLMAASSDNSSDCGLDGTVTPPLKNLPMMFDDIVAHYNAVQMPRGGATAIETYAMELITTRGLEDNFYIMDLGAVARLWRAWGESMPRVHPHYAVKCNNDPALLAVLASLGAGFDCASKAEVEQVIALGVSPDRIIFANPCKRPADIRAAAAKSVTHSTFDTEAELLKLRRWAPGSRVLLRIRADDPTARCPLGNKFGAEEWEWESLFAAARRHDVPVDGISFHVGSGATNPAAFSYAVELARRAFDLGAAYGFEMNILDIGGGFCGGHFRPDGRVDLGGVPASVNASLDTHFPEGSGVRIIAEPGRYFAESIATLATLVYGKRERAVDGAAGAPTCYDYWITDGLYGSMNCLLYDHATVAPRPLLLHANNENNTTQQHQVPCTVFGPTCDGLDTVVRDYPLPPLEVGDWLLFPRMGAYTICGASKFNGINAVDVATYYICSAEAQ